MAYKVDATFVETNVSDARGKILEHLVHFCLIGHIFFKETLEIIKNLLVLEF
jgi:hypothetical protein